MSQAGNEDVLGNSEVAVGVGGGLYQVEKAL